MKNMAQSNDLWVIQILTFMAAPAVLASNIGATSTVELDESVAAKLDHQFEKYNVGRDYLINRVVNQGNLVTRGDWDDVLSPASGELVMTEEDIATLTAYHAAVIEQAAAKARSDSIIAIDDFRSDESQVEQFCTDLPRVALLHIHPSGTAKEETVYKALEAINPFINTTALIEIGTGDLTMLYPSELEYLESIPSDHRYLDYSPDDQEKLADFLFMPIDPCCHDFPRFQAIFALVGAFFWQSDENGSYFDELTYNDFLERNRAYGIQYVEFTQPKIPSNADRLQSYNNVLTDLSQKHDMPFLNYNNAFVRTIDAETNRGFASNFIEAMQNNASDLPRVVGIDLLAEETNSPALEQGQSIYIPIYNAWKNEGIIDLGGMTMHAGELGEYGPENVRDGIIMGATRIGHGVKLIENPVYLEYNRRQQVPMVNNIVSNYALNAVEEDNFSNHPFLDLLRLGIPLTLSTDDEGMFRTDIVNECMIAVENSDIQYSELKAISYTSVTASFADEETKALLLAELDTMFEDFENKYTSGLPEEIPEESFDGEGMPEESIDEMVDGSI